MPPRSQKQKEAKARAVRRRAKHNNDVDVHRSAYIKKLESVYVCAYAYSSALLLYALVLLVR